MTVSYSKDVATSSFGYFLIRLVLRWFDHLAEYCEKYNNLIPVAFILGFYVSIVVSRFWEQLNALPWPQRTAFFVASMIHGCDERGRILRRTIMRYLTVAYILTMRSICPPVRKRFPSLQRIQDLGLITEEEQKVLTELGRINRTDRIDSDAFLKKDLEQLKKDVKDDEQGAHHEITPNVYYVPLLWAVDLVNEAMKEKRITDHSTQRVLIQEINDFRGQCGTLFNFDWITVPLVYTQVVTIAVYTFFLSCLLGRQVLDDHQGDLYFPVFTFLQFIFYMGWLEVAMCLLNPFGGDDDDFEINPLIEDNLQVAFTMVDELCDFSPKLVQDDFFNVVDVDIAYNQSSVEYRDRHYQGSADVHRSRGFDCCGSRQRKEDNTTTPSKEQEDKRIYKPGKHKTAPGSRGGPTVVTVDPARAGMSASVTQTTSFSETAPLLPDDKNRTKGAEDVRQNQQPVIGKPDNQGDDAAQTGRAGGGLSQAFIDQVQQSLHELRLGTRASIAARRSYFFNESDPAASHR